jgi:hypothetical protein
VLFDAPPFQKSNIKSTGRTVPDVAYNADTQSGVLAVYTQPRSNGTFRRRILPVWGPALDRRRPRSLPSRTRRSGTVWVI